MSVRFTLECADVSRQGTAQHHWLSWTPGDKGGARAVSVASQGFCEDCTITCANPLKTPRLQAPLQVVDLKGDDRDIFDVGLDRRPMRYMLNGRRRAGGFDLGGGGFLGALVAVREQRAGRVLHGPFEA